MKSKLIAACMALAAFAAFAVVPAMASAKNTPLVVENGTAVAVGTKILATNVNTTKMTTSLGNIECSSAEMTGELTKNTTGAVEGNITKALFWGTGAQQAGAPAPECTTQSFLGGDTTVTAEVLGGLPWCIRSNETMAEDEFQVRGGKCAEAARSIKFAMDITNVGTCNYERANAIPGKFTTSTTDSTLSIEGVEFGGASGNPFGCPGSGKLDMTFTMQTDASPFTALGITS